MSARRDAPPPARRDGAGDGSSGGGGGGDGETEENPHIPQFIGKAPWYVADGGKSAYLQHQRHTEAKPEDALKVHEWYKRGQFKSAATKFRKGACENCGAMTHKSRDCMDRPRARGAKVTGRDIKPDEIIEKFSFDYDSKRDSWAGYDTTDHLKLIEEFDRVTEARKKKRQEELLKKQMEEGAAAAPADAPTGDDADFREDSEVTDGIVATKVAVAAAKADPRSAAQSRSLRIREDRAKYLHNLDVDSAFFDPKSRSMREAPNPDDPDAIYQGDNALRDTKDFEQMLLFNIAASQHGQDVHMEAAPTQAALLHKKFVESEKRLAEASQTRLLDKYGGQEHLTKPKELDTTQTEAFLEYSQDGHLIKAPGLSVAQSRYEEDVHPQNHTTVFGSFYDPETKKWGYACCHQFTKNAYCTGESGIRAYADIKAAMKLREAQERAKQEAAEAEALRKEQEQANKSKRQLRAEAAEAERERQRKLADALRKEEALAASGKAGHAGDKRFGDSTDVSPEEMEAYLIKRVRADDPMAKLGKSIGDHDFV